MIDMLVWPSKIQFHGEVIYHSNWSTDLKKIHFSSASLQNQGHTHAHARAHTYLRAKHVDVVSLDYHDYNVSGSGVGEWKKELEKFYHVKRCAK